MSQELRAPLEAGLQALGLDLTPAQIDTLMEFQALLGKWNKVYNLTAVRDPQEMLTHHLLDSLAAVPALQRHLAQMPAREGRTAMLDVGSGGGLPGRSEEHTSELQSPCNLVCRLLLEKKKNKTVNLKVRRNTRTSSQH